MPGRSIKSFFNTMEHLLLFSFIILLTTGPVFAGEKSQNLTFSEFYPGSSASVLKKLSMPFPVDTANCHAFLNTAEGVVLRVELIKQSGKLSINTVHLTYLNDYPESLRNNDHLIKTGAGLAGFKTKPGIGLLSSLNDVKKAYGDPGKQNTSGGETYLEYPIEPGNKNGSIIFGVRNGRVFSVIVLKG